MSRRSLVGGLGAPPGFWRGEPLARLAVAVSRKLVGARLAGLSRKRRGGARGVRGDARAGASRGASSTTAGRYRLRCLMPVSGYYEWEDTPNGKQPHYFTARDGSPVLTIAGLWDEWKNIETGELVKSCTMIITDANAFSAFQLKKSWRMHRQSSISSY